MKKIIKHYPMTDRLIVRRGYKKPLLTLLIKIKSSDQMFMIMKTTHQIVLRRFFCWLHPFLRKVPSSVVHQIFIELELSFFTHLPSIFGGWLCRWKWWPAAGDRAFLRVYPAKSGSVGKSDIILKHKIKEKNTSADLSFWGAELSRCRSV